ncbi:hypothetical protein H5410_027986 [Solanum commersonii]|uniref:F-box domain-containing protein n=1 Tax=Solanum commersonii TaxID=4109 RepID=A0A9J5Z650_SOLCO|nr:hypothetical protein H5410_027986 [Solanum commersonii]
MLFKGDCKERTISYVTEIMDLPKDIMLEILSRLSIKYIFCCKTVCKLWYSLLTSDPLFVDMYHKRSSSNFPSLLLSRTIALSPMFHLPSPEMELIGSCNGFACFLKGWNYGVVHSLYISNPLLSEYYKFDGHLKALELEVCTLGVDEKWRYVGEVPQPLWRSFSNLTWTEEVKSLLALRGLIPPSYKLTLAELGNFQCLSDSNNSEYIDIWWMKEYGITKSWTKTRILKDTIQPNICSDRFIPISTWKDGEILMQ